MSTPLTLTAACDRIAMLERDAAFLYPELARFKNPWTVEIQNKQTGAWSEFHHKPPLTLADAEQYEEELKALHPKASFRVTPWLNNEQRQAIRDTQVRAETLKPLEALALRVVAQFPEVGKNNPALHDKLAQVFQLLISTYEAAHAPKRLTAIQYAALRDTLNFPATAPIALAGIDKAQLARQLEANARFPPCKCGGVAVGNASGDITRTCIRCGAIVRPVPTSPDPAVVASPATEEQPALAAGTAQLVQFGGLGCLTDDCIHWGVTCNSKDPLCLIGRTVQVKP